MTVRPDHEITGGDKAFFRQDNMFDTGFTQFKEMRYPVLSSKLPCQFNLLCRLDILVGHKMIRNKGDLVPVKYLPGSEIMKHTDSQWGRNIIG